MAKKLAGLITQSNLALFKTVKDEVDSYHRYESRDLKVIGLPGFLRTDSVVSDHMSYAQWISTRSRYTTVKVEGLESTLINEFNLTNIKDIHLFVNQRTAYSFKWHTDNVDVVLYVLKGCKTLQVRNKTYTLTAGSWAFIPKGHLHRAFSRKNTWALSLGLK
jgi:mannose-6-phosphate isomerase-like protein (cupin superfamily)